MEESVKNYLSEIGRKGGSSVSEKKKLASRKNGKKAQPSRWARILSGMRARCDNPKTPAYKYYGAKGIKCLMTLKEIKFLWFRDKAYEMEKPSIDRIIPTDDYFSGNCRFIELRINAGKEKREWTHCKKGHEFTAENTGINTYHGRRYCIKCYISKRGNKNTNRAVSFWVRRRGYKVHVDKLNFSVILTILSNQ